MRKTVITIVSTLFATAIVSMFVYAMACPLYTADVHIPSMVHGAALGMLVSILLVSICLAFKD